MDQWTDRLSEYLDGELPAAEQTALDAHLEECTACRDVLEGLRGVTAQAGALADRSPAEDLWPGIAAKLGLESGGTPVLRLDAGRRDRAPRRLLVAWPALAAAAVALMALSAGVSWLVSGRMRTGSPVAGETAPGLVSPAAAFASPAYDRAIHDLESVLVEGRGRLDTATVRVLERSLMKIDAAIAEARQAVAQDPGSAYLNTHLAETMRRKLDLLRRAAALVSAES